MDYGNEYDVATPVNQTLLLLIKSQIDTGDWRGQVGKLLPELRSYFAELASVRVRR